MCSSEASVWKHEKQDKTTILSKNSDSGCFLVGYPVRDLTACRIKDAALGGPDRNSRM